MNDILSKGAQIIEHYESCGCPNDRMFCPVEFFSSDSAKVDVIYMRREASAEHREWARKKALEKGYRLIDEVFGEVTIIKGA